MICANADAMDGDLVAGLWPSSRRMNVSSIRSMVPISIDFTRNGSLPGESHAGMILAPQKRFSVGEQLRRILRLPSATTTVSMRNRVEFLGNRA
jgi:hypothetical protein